MSKRTTHLVDNDSLENGSGDYDLADDASAGSVSHSDIARLAHQLWEQRGCPEGSPEEDWYEAEMKLKGDA